MTTTQTANKRLKGQDLYIRVMELAGETNETITSDNHAQYTETFARECGYVTYKRDGSMIVKTKVFEKEMKRATQGVLRAAGMTLSGLREVIEQK